MTANTPNAPEPQLAIPMETVSFIVDKLREYENSDLLADADEATAEEPAPLDCTNADTYIARGDDYRNQPVRQELESFINDLPEDQQIELVALMWLGRESSSAADWPAIYEAAEQAHSARTALYLLGSPLASDFLEEGLSILGYSVLAHSAWSEL